MDRQTDGACTWMEDSEINARHVVFVCQRLIIMASFCRRSKPADLASVS